MLLIARSATQAITQSKNILGSKTRLPFSLVKPVYSANSHTQLCFESWLNQSGSQNNLGPGQVIFSLQSDQDAALSILKSLKIKFSFEVTINPIRDGFSGKTSNLYYGVNLAKSDVLIFSDADIFALPETLGKMMSFFSNEKNQDSVVVSCLPLHVAPIGIWARIFARVWNAALVCIWAPSVLRKKAMGIAGGTIALSKGGLKRVGGFEGEDCWARYVAEDIALGVAAQKQGMEIHLGPLVESPVGDMSFSLLWEKLKRGNLISIHMAPMGVFQFIPVYLFMFSYLGFMIAALFHPTFTLLLTALILLVTRFLFCSWLDQLAHLRLHKRLDFILGDLLVLVSFVTSLFYKKVQWGQKMYKIGKGGILER